jgi:hypothetical protein
MSPREGKTLVIAVEDGVLRLAVAAGTHTITITP